MIDMDDPFAFNLNREDFNHKEVLDKLVQYGRMPWKDIDAQTHDKFGKSKHHFLSLESLSDMAIDRINAKAIEDTDAIFSFAFQNKLRVIGIRDHADFHIVWHDPNHQFAPRKKK